MVKTEKKKKEKKEKNREENRNTKIHTGGRWSSSDGEREEASEEG